MSEKAQKFLDMVESEELYLEPVYAKKREISNRLNLTYPELEKLVADNWGTTFCEWMNEKRIDEAKALLSSPEHLHISIIEIGFRSGYGAIPVFNTKFKEATGMTPSEYRTFHIHFEKITGVKPEDF